MDPTTMPAWMEAVITFLAVGGLYAALQPYITHVIDWFKRILTWAIVPEAIRAFFAVKLNMEIAVMIVGALSGFVTYLAVHFNFLTLLGPTFAALLAGFAATPWYGFLVVGLLAGFSASGVYKQNKAGTPPKLAAAGD